MCNANNIPLAIPEGETWNRWRNVKTVRLKQISYEAVRKDSSAAGQRPIQVNTAYRKVCKCLPQEAEVTQGVPGRLRPRIFLTFGTTRVVGRQPYARAAFTPGEIPGTYF